jgi:phosphohistidine phosphatase
MKLYLIRHAKTERESVSGRDFDRKLLARGKRQAADLSNYLKIQGIAFEKVICSSAERTKETLDLLDLGAKVEFLNELYLCSLQEMLKIINAQSIEGNLILIGHNNGISDLAGYLCGELIHMKTCELAILEFNGDKWSELSGDSAKLISSFRSSAD